MLTNGLFFHVRSEHLRLSAAGRAIPSPEKVISLLLIISGTLNMLEMSVLGGYSKIYFVKAMKKLEEVPSFEVRRHNPRYCNRESRVYGR